MSFWQGFFKAAEMLTKFNEFGGIEPRDPVAAQRAAAAGLMTLPSEVEGAHCGHCSFYKPMNEQAGMCMNEAVLTEVTPRMLCSQWSNPTTVQVGIPDQAAVTAPVNQNDPAQVDQAAAEAGIPADEPAPKKEPKKKEAKPAAININLGGKK